MGTDRFGNPITGCQFSSVTSITDDQLLSSMLAEASLPPVAPNGPRRIEVGEQDEQGTPLRQIGTEQRRLVCVSVRPLCTPAACPLRARRCT